MTQHLGRYELSRFIARGGMAEVFEGYSIGASGFRRRVAIKRLVAAEAESPAMLRMFLDEARICSALHHAGIVSVLDYGVVDGAPFQVMEYVDGVNASELLHKLYAAGRALPEQVALYICRSVAYALAHAHEATDAEGSLGIVHRDVKPANILLSWAGDVKLADFGIALGRAREERTEAGQIKGTMNYMAPEQTAGLPVDGRADVFSLGCVLHALTTGASPLANLATSLLLLRRTEAPLHPSLSSDVHRIVKKALHAEPELRFVSARSMAEVIDGAIAARSHQDPRAELEALLSSVRSNAAEPRKQGALDHLLDLAFVQRTDHDREYQSIRTKRTTVDDAPSVEPTRQPASAHGAPKPARGRSWLVAGVSLGALALGVGATLRTRAVPVAAPLGSAADPIPAPSLTSNQLTLSPAVPSAPASMAPDTPPVSASTRRAAPKTSASPAVAQPPATGTGFVAFRALAGGTRTTIVIDGAQRGFAPKVLELSLGSHLVSYLSASGATFGATRIEVRPDFSRASPKVIDVAMAE